MNEVRTSSVTKRTDERYQAYVYVPGQPRQYVYDGNRQECKRKQGILEEQLKSGIVKSNMLMKDYIKKWLEVDCANLSPTTIATHTRKVNRHVVPTLGDLKVRAVDRNNIQRLITTFGETHAEKTSKDLKAIIHRIFECAKLDKIIKDNPCTAITVKPTISYEYDIYTTDEMSDFLGAVVGTVFEIPVLLAVLCGMRLSEICGLKWDCVDFAEKTITIKRACVVADGKVIEKTPKTKSSLRTIIMPTLVAESLKKVRGLAKGYVYPNQDGGAQNGVNLSKRIARFRKKNGFPHTRFHDLRHFNATSMLEGGISDIQAAANLGHSNINMTKKYQHISKSYESRPARLMDELFKGKEKGLTPELTPNHSSNAD